MPSVAEQRPRVFSSTGGGGSSEAATVVETHVNRDTVPLAAGMLVALHPSGTGVWRASASLRRAAHGVALSAIGVGAAGSVLLLGELILSDWTALTGTVSLSALGLYYLAEAGQLTAVPSEAPGSLTQLCGAAVGPQVMSVDAQVSILL